MEVVFSKRAMIALLVETREKISTETGGVFLGKYESGVWYIVETIDPGPNSIFKPAYFEYDQEYVNHLINKVSRLYKNQLDLIGLWHRHPGSMDTFSTTDDGTNIKYAQLADYGAISGLVNIDPDFRLTLYHISLPLKYEKITYSVDDERIPKSIAELREPFEYSKQLGKIQKTLKRKQKTSFASLFDKTKRINVIKTIHEFLKKRTISDVKPLDAKGYDGELPIEEILELMEQDFNFFEENGIDYSISIGEAGLLNLSIQNDKDSLCLFFVIDKEKSVVFIYNEITYKYRRGLLLNAIKEKGRLTL